jgi:lactate permease
MEWVQVYDPLGSPWLSTAMAAAPIVILLGLLVAGMAAHRAVTLAPDYEPARQVSAAVAAGMDPGAVLPASANQPDDRD